MKRDIDLIRDLLLQIESKDISDGNWVDIDLNGRDGNTVVDHLFLLFKAGFIEGNDLNTISHRMFKPRRLTWSGHDFLDSVRDEETWKKTKDGALQAGGWTFDLMKDLAKGIIKKKLEDASGIKL